MLQNKAAALATNQFSRISGTFISPISTFREVVKSPGWIVPLLLSTVLSLAYTFEMGQHVGWAALIQYRIAHSAYAGLPAGEQDAFIQQQLPMTMTMGYLYASLGTAIELVIVATILYVLFADGRLRFEQAFSIVSYAFLPSALAAFLGAIVIGMKNPEDIDPNRVLMTDVGAFLGQASIPATLSALLASLDFFSLWILVLTSIGFWVASGSKNFSVSLLKVSVPWAIWIAAKIVLT